MFPGRLNPFTPQKLSGLWGLFVCLLAPQVRAQDADPVNPPPLAAEAAEVSTELEAILPQPPFPFKAGEELHYKIGWGIFAVGTAVITVEEGDWESAPAWKFTMRARTNGFADKFYKVRNEAVSYADPELTHSLHYISSQNEGGNEKKTVFHFDWEHDAVRYQNLTDNTLRDWVAVPEHIYDVISLTFFLRTLPLEVGNEMTVPTTNGKEVMLSSVEVVKKEEKKFRAGRFDTVLVEPNVKDLGGVFKKSKDAAIHFWFSDDNHRFPLRMESEVAVGSFWVELEKVVLPNDEVIETETEDPRLRAGRRR